MPDHEREAREEQRDVDEEVAARESRETGGDAQAAGSLEEREAVAEDDDDLFEGDDSDQRSS